MQPTNIGRVRTAVEGLPAYRPGKGAAQAEREHGISDAVKLASNENPEPPIPAVVEAVARAAAGANRYPDHRAEALRSAIAGWVGAVDPAQVTVGCGSVGLLQQILLTYVDPGDEVVYPWRSFEAYPIYTQLVGGREVTVPLVDHAFDVDGVIAATTPATKVVLLASPNNPTGTALTTAQVADVLDAVGTDVIVVHDEAYHEFADPALGDPVRDLVPHHPNIVVLRTFSKAHGMAGLRVGYAIGHPDVVTSIDKTLVPFAVNAIAQAAALAAIGAAAEIGRRVEAILAERSRVLAALVEAGWRLPPTQANFAYLPLGPRADEVYLALERRGVVTRPFSNEGIRVTIGTPPENDRFLAAISEVVPDGGAVSAPS